MSAYRNIHHDDIEKPANERREFRVEHASKDRDVLQRRCIASEWNDRKSRGTSSQPLEQTVDHLLSCWKGLIYRYPNICAPIRGKETGATVRDVYAYSIQGNKSIR